MKNTSGTNIPGEAESLPLPSSVEDDGKGKETSADAGTLSTQGQSPEQTNEPLGAGEPWWTRFVPGDRWTQGRYEVGQGDQVLASSSNQCVVNLAAEHNKALIRHFQLTGQIR